VGDGHAAPAHLQLGQVAVDLDVLVAARYPGQVQAVAIVVAEHRVHCLP